jgi:hypothetical protein
MNHLQKSATVALTAILLLAALAFSFSSRAYGQMSSDHMTSDQSHIPVAEIGNQKLALDFKTTPASPLPADNIDMNLYLFDNSTNKAVLHVTYTVVITAEDGRQVFSLPVHGHEGKVSLRFIEDNSTSKYKVSANYDDLSASYISDFGSPIKIQGKVFEKPGNYNIAIDVIGINLDNESLREPVKYSFTLPVTPKQTVPVKYQQTTFQVGAYSSLTISGAELFTEKKQLVLHSTGSNTTSAGDLKIRLEIPKQMMSGPFTASYGDGSAALDVREETASDQSTTLVLTGKHSDMGHSNTSDGSIVIAAANVVPEFPAGLAGSIVAVGFLGVILYIRAFKK